TGRRDKAVHRSRPPRTRARARQYFESDSDRADPPCDAPAPAAERIRTAGRLLPRRRVGRFSCFSFSFREKLPAGRIGFDRPDNGRRPERADLASGSENCPAPPSAASLAAARDFLNCSPTVLPPQPAHQRTPYCAQPVPPARDRVSPPELPSPPAFPALAQPCRLSARESTAPRLARSSFSAPSAGACGARGPSAARLLPRGTPRKPLPAFLRPKAAADSNLPRSASFFLKLVFALSSVVRRPETGSATDRKACLFVYRGKESGAASARLRFQVRKKGLNLLAQKID